MSYPPGNNSFNSRVVIDACIPWLRKATFPPVVRSSKPLDERIFAKFKDVLPKS